MYSTNNEPLGFCDFILIILYFFAGRRQKSRIMLSVDWQGLVLPLAYLSVLTGTFMTFSTIYRKRKASMFSALSLLG